MPINKRTLGELISQVNMTDPYGVEKRKLSRFISSALFFAQETAIPFDGHSIRPPVGEDGQLDMSQINGQPTPRQLRFALIDRYQTMLGDLNDLIESSGPAVTEVALQFQRSIKLLREVAEHDQESVSFLPFTQSAIGRKHLARAIASAHQQVGSRPMEAKPIIDADMTLAYQDQLYKYLDEQFPVTGNDLARPKLNDREALILAREFYEALTDHSNLSNAANLVNQFMVEGARNMRYDLPLIEGVATPEYWEQRIVEGFENATLREDYNHLIGEPALQDKLPVETILRTLIDAGNSTRFNNIDPIIQYLDTDSPLDYEHVMNLGHSDDNLILVFQDEQGQPAIATQHHEASQSLVRVFRPGHNPTIVDAPRDTDRSLEEAAQERLATLSAASQSLTPAFNPSQTAERLKGLQTKWRSAVNEHLPHDPVTFGDRLASIQKDIRETAKEIVIPGFGGEANKENLQSLVKLCAMTGFCELRSTKITLGLPPAVGLRASSDKPDTEIAFSERDGEPDQCNITIRRPEGETLEVIEGQKKSEANPIAIKAASQYGLTTSVANKAFPVGMVSYEIIDDSKAQALPAGHWLSDEARQRCTEVHTSALPFLKWKGEPLFKDDSQRTPEEATRLMASTVTLVHDKYLDFDRATVAGDHAMSETLMLTIDLDDQFGSTRCDLPATVYEQCTLEDIRRHLIQKISYADLDESTRNQMCKRAATESWEAAENRMAIAYEELELHESELDTQGLSQA